MQYFLYHVLGMIQVSFFLPTKVILMYIWAVFFIKNYQNSIFPIYVTKYHFFPLPLGVSCKNNKGTLVIPKWSHGSYLKSPNKYFFQVNDTEVTKCYFVSYLYKLTYFLTINPFHSMYLTMTLRENYIFFFILLSHDMLFPNI